MARSDNAHSLFSFPYKHAFSPCFNSFAVVCISLDFLFTIYNFQINSKFTSQHPFGLFRHLIRFTTSFPVDRPLSFTTIRLVEIWGINIIWSEFNFSIPKSSHQNGTVAGYGKCWTDLSVLTPDVCCCLVITVVYCFYFILFYLLFFCYHCCYFSF